MAKRKDFKRYSVESLTIGEEDPRGNLFISEIGQFNSERINILHTGIDTVRQLYTGNLNPEIFDKVKTAYGEGFRQVVKIGGLQFVVGSGAQGGYRYTLRNSEVGIIALLGSRHVEVEDEGSHLKLELSPHYIQERDIATIQAEMDKLARLFLMGSMPCGIAIHLCVDIQGWSVPEDFEKRFVTRSKRQMTMQGIESLSIESGAVSAVYGDRETFMFGSAGAHQFAMYRKDKEAKAGDKLHYWEDVWRKKTDDEFKSLYSPERPVWRFEQRFHHNVIKEFARGLDTSLNSLKQLEPHLSGLWQYACNNYRLDSSRTYIDPFWQFLRDDVQIAGPAPHILYKRVRKGPGVGNERNVAAALGNLITLYAKNGFTAKQAYHFLENTGIWDDLLAWQMKKEFSKSEFLQFLEKEMCIRRLSGKAA